MLILIGLSIAKGASQVPLPDAQPNVAPVLTTIQDEIVAREFLKLIREQMTIVEDPQLSDYVTGLAKRLAANAGFDSSNFRVIIVDNNAVNALAGPGATFVFFTGLVDLAATEGEFASVVAHEIAHHTQRHLPQMMERQKDLAVPSMIAVLGGLIAGGSEGLGLAVTAAAAQKDALIRYTLHFEREADAIALRILAASNIEPRQARNFMDSLEQWIRLAGARQSSIHNTHPLTPERIANVENRLRAYEGRNYDADSNDFQLAKARSTVLNNFVPSATVASFVEQVDQGDQGNAGLYGLALALSKDNRHDEAQQNIGKLITKDPNNTWFILANAEIELASGNSESAKQILENALKFNQSLSLAELYANILLDAKQAKEAKRLVRKIILDHPKIPRLHKLHARASAQANDAFDVHFSTAEYYYLNGQLNAAMKQLNLAEDIAGNDFYRAERVKEKQKKIRTELSWQK